MGFLIALIFAYGALSYTRLGRNEDPSFTIKLLVVTATWPGATAQETQDLLVEPVERKLQDLAHLDHLSTFVRPGFAAVMVSFADSTPPAEVPNLFYQTRKKLDDLKPSLPDGVRGPNVNDEYVDVYGAVFALNGPAALGNVPIPAGGSSLKLSDIATISRGYTEPPQYSVRHNGEPAVVVALSLLKGSNGLEFGKALHAEAARIQADLPAGIVMQQIADQPEVIGEAVGEFVLKFCVALGVVMLVSFASLGWRVGVLLLPNPKPHAAGHASTAYETPIYRRLRALVRWSVRHRKLVVLATVALFLAAGAGMGLVRQQFFPNSARPELIVDVTLRQGASHQATEAAVRQVETLLGQDRDVRWFTSYVGGGPPRFFLAFNPALPNDAIATIILTTTDTQARERVRARIMDFAAKESVPQARVRVSRLELGPPVGFPVQFRVVGENIAAVRASADRVLEALRQTPGTRDAQLAWSERAPSLRLELDQARVRQLGLTPADISGALATLVSGSKATELRDRTKRIAVMLRAVPAERLDLSHLPDFMLSTAAGWLPLAQVARVVADSEEPILWRRDRQSYLTVQADIQDGLQAPDVTAAALPAIQALPLPAGVTVETGGAAEESAKANGALVAVLPLMVGAMLLLLMIQLQSIPRTLLVLATMPLGIIGATAALLLADAPFGFVALLGVLALGGMIMRNTIILVDQVRQDLEAGRTLRDAIVESTVRRARPVVLTALAAALAFIPLATNVFWGPMALAMIGGLVVATVLTLMFLPALYAWAFRVKSEPEPQAAAEPRGTVVALGRPIG